MTQFPPVAACVAAALIALSLSANAGAVVRGPEAASCAPGASGPAVRVNVTGLKARTGDVRVRLYGDDRSKFLVHAGRLKRFKVAIPSNGRMEICVAVPRPGRYAIAVHHDLDGDGDRGWSDGGGFSRNPSLSLVRLKPRLDQVIFAVGPGINAIDVRMLYRKGLSIRPARTA